MDGVNDSSELKENVGRAFVGTVANHQHAKGWFFGSFMDEPGLQSDLVEVAWQQLPNLSPAPDQAHFHTSSVEINIVIRGGMTLNIDGERHRLEAGQFYVVWPQTVVSDIETREDTELIVIRAPSAPGDKVAVD